MAITLCHHLDLDLISARKVNFSILTAVMTAPKASALGKSHLQRAFGTLSARTAAGVKRPPQPDCFHWATAVMALAWWQAIFKTYHLIQLVRKPIGFLSLLSVRTQNPVQ